MTGISSLRQPFRTVDRRRFLAGAAAGVAALSLPQNLRAATAPHVFKHGAFEIAVVSDGMFVLDRDVFAPKAPKAELDALLQSAGPLTEKVEVSINSTVIRTANDLIVVDSGAGSAFGPSAGKQAENIAAGNIDPAKVTKVFFTHGHPDHLGGTLAPGNTLRFPNATYYVPEAEWNFWMSPEVFKQLPEAFHGFAKLAQAQWSPTKERLKTVKDGDEIASGVRVIAANGHTPGHSALELAGGLFLLGDTVSHALVSFAQPDWDFGFDAIPEAARASRKRLLDRAASEKAVIVGYHLPYPGVGRVERKDNAYRFVAG